MSLINIFQQANVNVDNQQVKDNLQRQQSVTDLVKDVQAKEKETKQIQANKTQGNQAISPASKG